MILTVGGQNKNVANSLRTKTWMIMKLTIAFLLFFTFQINAKPHAQRITIVKNNIHLSEVFRTIEQQTGFHFFYDKDMILKTAPIDVALKDATLEQALSACLKGQQLTYTIVRNTIVIQAQEIYKSAVFQLADVTALPPPVEIHGRVVDEQGKPLQNVSVLIVGTKIGTTTDSDGRWTLTAPNNRNIVVEFTSVGYQNGRVSVGSQTEITLTLKRAISGLDDVVVVGYGTQRKGDLTGAITSVSSKDIKNQPFSNLNEALEGRVPGAEITAASGEPGAPLQIRIRGMGTFGNTGPLYIVDGVPIDVS
ncbi:MAG TPA: carboxypeptidase-like regulatory domain-containing protein, partial [Hanamia sp.]|nr:carboxypeptidase-like regulatory domain-containing protein [Hanamia sp.]